VRLAETMTLRRHDAPLDLEVDETLDEVTQPVAEQGARDFPENPSGTTRDRITRELRRASATWAKTEEQPTSLAVMSEILDAVRNGASGETLAAHPLPASTRAVFVLRDEQNMFDGVTSKDKDPRRSLHVDEVPLPELATDEVFLAVMASSINFNTVWTSIFEPLPTFGFLDRLAKESFWANATPCLITWLVRTPRVSSCAPARRCVIGRWATRSPCTATTSTTRTRRVTTTRCSPRTSASGGSRPTSAVSLTLPW